MCLVDSVVGKLAVLIFEAMSTSGWSVCVCMCTFNPHPGKWANSAVKF